MIKHIQLLEKHVYIITHVTALLYIVLFCKDRPDDGNKNKKFRNFG